MRYGKICLVILLSMLARSGFCEPAAEKPVKILDARDNAYVSSPVISIPLNEAQAVEYYTMTLVPNQELGPGALKERKFSPAAIAPGDELEINGYLVAERAFDSFTNVEKGPDAPLFEQVREAFNQKDSAAFLRQIKKLAEQRMGAKNKQQLKEMAVGFGQDPDNPLALDYYSLNDYLYGTGFIEVSAKKLKNANADVLYYVPVDAISEGKVKIDLKQAKLEVLKGLSYFAFSKAPATATKETKELQSWFQSCADSPACSLASDLKLGDTAADILDILALGRSLDLDPKDEARLAFRKQLCILSRLFLTCESAKRQMERVKKLIAKEKLDCARERSLLKGIHVKY